MTHTIVNFLRYENSSDENHTLASKREKLIIFEKPKITNISGDNGFFYRKRHSAYAEFSEPLQQLLKSSEPKQKMKGNKVI